MSNFLVHKSPRQNSKPIKHWTKGVVLHDNAKEQLERLSELPFIHKHVAAMPTKFRIRREIYADGRIVYVLEKEVNKYGRESALPRPGGPTFVHVANHGQLPFLQAVISKALAMERSKKKVSDTVVHIESA